MKEYKVTIPELSLKYKTSETKKIKITSPKDTYNYAKELFDADLIEYREEVIVIFCNRANNTTGFMKISSGGVAGSIVDNKMILSSALLAGSSNILLAHNHPSNNTEPSSSDKHITEKLKDAANLLDINLLDHVIVGSDSYFSFAEEGLI